jgi:protein-disulfide isomerase
MARLTVPVTQKDHILGPADAPITLVEYGDYQCPFCRVAHAVVQGVLSRFGNQIRFVFRNFPLTNVHPEAETAAEAAEFAADHGKFWEMHHLLFENQPMLSLALILELAATLQLPVEEIQKALQTEVYRQKVKNDFLGGVHSGVNGTPTFFINNERVNVSYTDLPTVIEALL